MRWSFAEDRCFSFERKHKRELTASIHAGAFESQNAFSICSSTFQRFNVQNSDFFVSPRLHFYPKKHTYICIHITVET